MIIDRGKSEGWLQLDAHAMQSWLEDAGVRFDASLPCVTPGRGNVLVASEDLPAAALQQAALLTVPGQLVLSFEAVKAHAQHDQDFREVFECLGEFGQSLPCEPLPTFWSDNELKLLVGTTLAPAVSSKLGRLRREYGAFCWSASKTKWFQAVEPYLDFEDWLHVDAMFRSRALEFHGSCMIPGMDLASHAAGEATNAFYDKSDGLYQLWLMDGKSITKGDEVMITYGDEKGACEMIFSYGFLDGAMDTAEKLFLDLFIPEEDEFRSVKARIANCAPGFKIIDTANSSGHTYMPEKTRDQKTSSLRPIEQPFVREGEGASESEASAFIDHISSGAIDWKGDFVWLLVVNEEDGLRFDIVQTDDGEEEVQACFCDQPLKDGAADLRRILSKSSLWDVFRLRAVVLLQRRVYEQLQLLYETQDEAEGRSRGDDAKIGARPYQLAMKLRELEFKLLEKAYEDFEAQKFELAESAVVKKFLAKMQLADPNPAPKADAVGKVTDFV